MAYTIEFYCSESQRYPVEEFLNRLPVKHRAKAIRELELLETYGWLLLAPHTRKIQGNRYAGLYELRIKFASNISRIIYFGSVGNIFVLLHGFVKKSNKTPRRELETALRRMKNYKERKSSI